MIDMHVCHNLSAIRKSNIYVDKDRYMQGCCRLFRRGPVHAVRRDRGHRLRRKQVAHVCVFSIFSVNQTGIQSDHA